MILGMNFANKTFERKSEIRRFCHVSLLTPNLGIYLERFWTHTAQFIIDEVYPNIFRPHTKYFPWRRKPSSNWLSHSCHAAVSRSHTRHTSLKPNLSVQSGINYLTIPRQSKLLSITINTLLYRTKHSKKAATSAFRLDVLFW